MRLARLSACPRCLLVHRLITAPRRSSPHPGSPTAMFSAWVTNGASERDVALVTGIARSTLRDAAGRLRKVVEDANGQRPLTFAAAAASLSSKPTGRPRTKMTDAVLARLRELVLNTEATSWSNAQLRDQLILEFPHLNDTLHPTSVSKALSGMGITLKKPTVLALNAMRQENVEKRRRFARRFFRNVDLEAIGDFRCEAKAFREWIPLLDPQLVFFGDQSGFNQTTANARKARSLRGEPAPALRPYVKGKNHSLMLIVGHRDGIVASDVIPGGYNRERLVDFFRKHFIPYIRRYRNSLPESKKNMTIRLVLDNAPIHTAQSVQDLLMEEASVRLTFLPPYSPVLNPCENVFSMLKTSMRGDPFGDPDPLGPAEERSRFLIEHIYLHLSSILGKHVRAFYRHCAWGRPGPADIELFAQLPFGGEAHDLPINENGR